MNLDLDKLKEINFLEKSDMENELKTEIAQLNNNLQASQVIFIFFNRCNTTTSTYLKKYFSVKMKS